MKFIDLSHPISSHMSTYPSDPSVKLSLKKTIEKNNSLLHEISMGTHTGTHLDVPAHIINNGKTLENIPLECFAGNAVKVDNDSYMNLFKIKDSLDGVIFDTNWYKNFNDPKKFYGSDRPVIPYDLIVFLLKIKVKFFGCDLPSVDVSGSKDKPIHHALLESDIIIYESLTNLDKLPLNVPFKYYGFPLSIDGMDGCPVRAVGVI